MVIGIGVGVERIQLSTNPWRMPRPRRPWNPSVYEWARAWNLYDHMLARATLHLKRAAP